MSAGSKDPDAIEEQDDSEPTLSDDPDRRASERVLRKSDARIRHSDPVVRARLRRQRRRTTRLYIGIAVGLLVLLVGYVVLYFAPILSVRQITVSGERTIGAAEVSERANVEIGTPLLQVDTHSVARRLAGIPQINEVTVSRDYPSTLHITVVEREAVVVAQVDDAMHLVDGNGVDFGEGVAPEGTPTLWLGSDSREHLTTIVQDLAEILQLVRSHIDVPVTEINVDTPADIVLTLEDGRKVEWGAAGRDQEKAAALRLVLSQPGEVWNVSNPALPASR